MIITGKNKLRFYKKFNINKKNGCWIWNASSNSAGYGLMRINYEYILAHRLSWMIYKGEIPAGLCVLHNCDIPACVNPDHLFIGSQKENIKDMISKNRNSCGIGEKNGHSILSEKIVLEIRNKYIPKKYSMRMLAKEYGVTPQNIFSIVKNKTWNI